MVDHDSKSPKGVPIHEVYETPEQKYRQMHAGDGEAKTKALKIVRKLFLDDKDFESLKEKRERVKKLKMEKNLTEEEKKLDEELASYKKENKRVRQIYNDFKNGGAKSSGDWKDAMKALKDAKGFGDIVPAGKKTTKNGVTTEEAVAVSPSGETTEVVIIEEEPKKEEPISIW